MNIYTSTRFLKSYHKASLGLQRLTEGAVHDLVNRYRSDSSTMTRNYDRLSSIDDPILKIDLSGGHRLLAIYRERLVLLDMGNHEVLDRYTKRKLDQDLTECYDAPAQFWPETGSRFFISFPDKTIPFHYQDEISPDWLYFLEEEQNEILTEIYVSVFEALQKDNKTSFPFLILGGAGTGKTCILLNLLKHLTDDGYRVQIHISSNLLEYIESSTGASLDEYCVSLRHFGPADVLLIDDPENFEDLRMAMMSLKHSSLKSVVIAFDPLQLKKSLSDQEF